MTMVTVGSQLINGLRVLVSLLTQLAKPTQANKLIILIHLDLMVLVGMLTLEQQVNLRDLLVLVLQIVMLNGFTNQHKQKEQISLLLMTLVDSMIHIILLETLWNHRVAQVMLVLSVGTK